MDKTSHSLEDIRQQPTLFEKMPASAQTEALCLAAVQDNGRALQYVKHQTPALCLAAVQQNGNALMYVREQSPDICLAAIQETASALELVLDQTLEQIVTAVAADGSTLEYVHLPCDELHLANSGQLERWCQVLRACETTDNWSIDETLIPLMQAIPLGKQVCDEWSQATPPAGRLLDRLIDLAGELERLAPNEPEVTHFVSRVQQQQEWILRRQLSQQNDAARVEERLREHEHIL